MLAPTTRYLSQPKPTPKLTAAFEQLGLAYRHHRPGCYLKENVELCKVAREMRDCRLKEVRVFQSASGHPQGR